MKGTSKQIISVFLASLFVLPAPQLWAGPCYGPDPCDLQCPDHCTREECGPPSPCDESCPSTYDPWLSQENTRSWHYTYDGLNRLIGADFGRLNDANTAIESTTDAPSVTTQRWWLDSLGNWSANPQGGSYQTREDSDGDGLFGSDDDPAEAEWIVDQPVDGSNQIDAVIENGVDDRDPTDPQRPSHVPVRSTAFGNNRTVREDWFCGAGWPRNSVPQDERCGPSAQNYRASLRAPVNATRTPFLAWRRRNEVPPKPA